MDLNSYGKDGVFFRFYYSFPPKMPTFIRFFVMKKIVVILICLLTAGQAFAQNLDGSWRGPLKTDESKEGMDLSVTGEVQYTFSGEHASILLNLNIDIAMIEGNGKEPDFQVDASNSGTWKIDGKYLDFFPGPGAYPAVSVRPNGVPALIAKIIEIPIRKEVTKILRTPGRFELVRATDKELVLREVKSGWDKKGKVTKPVSYRRQ